MAWSERFLRVFNFTAAAESFSESVDALDTSIIDLVEELDASKENAQAVVFIMQVNHHLENKFIKWSSSVQLLVYLLRSSLLKSSHLFCSHRLVLVPWHSIHGS